MVPLLCVVTCQDLYAREAVLVSQNKALKNDVYDLRVQNADLLATSETLQHTVDQQANDILVMTHKMQELMNERNELKKSLSNETSKTTTLEAEVKEGQKNKKKLERSERVKQDTLLLLEQEKAAKTSAQDEVKMLNTRVNELEKYVEMCRKI